MLLDLLCIWRIKRSRNYGFKVISRVSDHFSEKPRIADEKPGFTDEKPRIVIHYPRFLA